MFKGMDAILVARASASVASRARFWLRSTPARTGCPTLVSAGMQIAIIEFARDVCGLKDAHSTEFNFDTPDPVVGLITEWQDATGEVQKRTRSSDKGTMRLGAQKASLKAGCWQRASTVAPRSTNGTAIATRSTAITSRSSRRKGWSSRSIGGAGSGRGHGVSAKRASVVPWRAVPPRVQLHAARRHPLFKAFVALQWRSARRCSRKRRAPKKAVA